MFTGIVEEVGEIADVTPLGGGYAFHVRARRVLDGMSPGDSIAVDGACLTVAELLPDGFSVQSVATTLERTIMGEYAPGRRVNLERALAFGERLGGHLVQGHVDGVGRVRRIDRREELVLIDIGVPEEVAAVTVLHGSITINGISLTVNQIPAPCELQVSIIPFTWQHTTAPDLREGDPVNVEADLIGKYVRQLLGRPGEGDASDLRRSWGYQ